MGKGFEFKLGPKVIDSLIRFNDEIFAIARDVTLRTDTAEPTCTLTCRMRTAQEIHELFAVTYDGPIHTYVRGRGPRYTRKLDLLIGGSSSYNTAHLDGVLFPFTDVTVHATVDQDYVTVRFDYQHDGTLCRLEGYLTDKVEGDDTNGKG